MRELHREMATCSLRDVLRPLNAQVTAVFAGVTLEDAIALTEPGKDCFASVARWQLGQPQCRAWD